MTSSQVCTSPEGVFLMLFATANY